MRSRSVRRHRRDRDRGQSLVEFALVLPVFFLVLFGIVDVGRYVYVTNAFSQAAREGARYGSVEQWSFSCPASVPIASRTISTCTAATTRGRIAAAPANFNVNVTCSTTNCRMGDLLTVQVTTAGLTGSQRFSFFTPVIGQILGNPVITGEARVVIQ